MLDYAILVNQFQAQVIGDKDFLVIGEYSSLKSKIENEKKHNFKYYNVAVQVFT